MPSCFASSQGCTAQLGPSRHVIIGVYTRATIRGVRSLLTDSCDIFPFDKPASDRPIHGRIQLSFPVSVCRISRERSKSVTLCQALKLLEILEFAHCRS